MIKNFSVFLLFLCFLSSCYVKNESIPPNISYSPSPLEVKQLLSLSPPTKKTTSRWEEEKHIATAFAKELDFYRAITAYKRALHLIPQEEKLSQMEINYFIIQCYYFAAKYQDVIDTFENSSLKDVEASFPAFNDLLIILHDSYRRLGKTNKMQKVMEILEQKSPDTAQNVKLSSALLEGDLTEISSLAQQKPSKKYIANFMQSSYKKLSKSPGKAQIYNAIIPGTGYLYVGQTRSAFTSFCLNSLFIAATYHFFDHGNTAAGILAASFELGWYIGGINGAGLAAQDYNCHLYEKRAKKILEQENLFPFFMLQYAF